MKKFIVLDTEATNTGKADRGRFGVGAQVYDLGYVVADASGAVYYHNNIIVADTFNDAALMRSAYYADKMPQYYQALAQGTAKLMNMRDALKTLRGDIRTYDVKSVWAYNAMFDRDALNSTVSTASNGFCDWALPYGCKWQDIMRYAQTSIAGTKKYRTWCEARGLITKTGKPRVTAEAVFQYLTQDVEYTEQHTALQDAFDELVILLACLKRKGKQPKKFN